MCHCCRRQHVSMAMPYDSVIPILCYSHFCAPFLLLSLSFDLVFALLPQQHGVYLSHCVCISCLADAMDRKARRWWYWWWCSEWEHGSREGADGENERRRHRKRRCILVFFLLIKSSPKTLFFFSRYTQHTSTQASVKQGDEMKAEWNTTELRQRRCESEITVRDERNAGCKGRVAQVAMQKHTR